MADGVGFVAYGEYAVGPVAGKKIEYLLSVVADALPYRRIVLAAQRI